MLLNLVRLRSAKAIHTGSSPVRNSRREPIYWKVFFHMTKERFMNRFAHYADYMVSELESEFLSKLGLSVIMDTAYDFNGKNWLAVYERSRNGLSEGKIIIGVNLPLFYRRLRNADDFNIKAQAYITIGHEIGHAVVEYLIDYCDVENESIEEFIHDYNDGVFDEEEEVERFGECMFPEATGTYSCRLMSLLYDITASDTEPEKMSLQEFRNHIRGIVTKKIRDRRLV